MWKEAIMAQFELLSQHSIGRNEKTHESTQDSRSPGRSLNTVPPPPPGTSSVTRSKAKFGLTGSRASLILSVFWDTTPCSLVDVSVPSIRKQQVPLKRR
jgi:hypothetical protein